MKVLITGGAGYIGSTIASACADSGMTPVVLDDLSTGLRSFAERFAFYEGDYGDPGLVGQVVADQGIEYPIEGHPVDGTVGLGRQPPFQLPMAQGRHRRRELG